MKTFTRLIAMTLLAILVVLVAILSIQNIELVTIRFLRWESIEIPFGIILAAGLGLGLLMGSFISLGR